MQNSIAKESEETLKWNFKNYSNNLRSRKTEIGEQKLKRQMAA